ncbi:MAG: hypothetical protein QW372_01740 [Nitrososphaerales archaeon]
MIDFSKFKKSDVLIVGWSDASVSKGIKFNNSIPNRTLDTPQFDVGFYAGIYKGLNSKRSYVVLVNEITDYMIGKWVAIPCSIVDKVYFVGQCPEDLINIITNIPEKVVKKVIRSIKYDLRVRRGSFKKYRNRMVIKRFD